MMQLPLSLQKTLWQDLQNLERNQSMPYVTSVERIGIEKGLQQGLQQGRQEGRQEGEGVLLQKLLQRRFGALPEWVGQRVAQAAPDQLESWGLSLLDALSLDDVFNAH